MRCLFVVSSILAWILCQGSSAAAEPDPAEVAARDRQEAVKTIALEFKCTEVTARGAISHEERAEPLPDVPNAVPREESTRESTNRLVIDGKKARYEDNHIQVFSPDGTIVNGNRLILCDGTATTTFFPKGMGMTDGSPPSGIIDTMPGLESAKTSLLWPITMTYRAFDPQIISYPWAGILPTGASLVIEGVECREYEIKPSTTTSIRFWLDPTSDFIPRRISYWKKGLLREQLDIAFERHEPTNWVPVSWVRKRYALDGGALVTTRVEVVSLRLNEPQPADLFEMSFPPGTRVNDNGKKKAYIVQANGDMHEVTPGFTEIPNPVTVATQPGVLWFQRYKWLILGLAGILFLVGILLLIVWKKKHPAT
jgi:hypothetical protein